MLVPGWRDEQPLEDGLADEPGASGEEDVLVGEGRPGSRAVRVIAVGCPASMRLEVTAGSRRREIERGRPGCWSRASRLGDAAPKTR